jgi:hypothetical protein
VSGRTPASDALPGAGFYGPPRFFADRLADFEAPLLMLLASDDVATTTDDEGMPPTSHTSDGGVVFRWQ